jgi:hypothetical protein
VIHRLPSFVDYYSSSLVVVGLEIGNDMNLAAGIQIAQLALKHQQNKNQHQEVVANQAADETSLVSQDATMANSVNDTSGQATDGVSDPIVSFIDYSLSIHTMSVVWIVFRNMYCKNFI